MAGSVVGRSDGYEYLDSAAAGTAGTAGQTAGQTVVNTTFATASAQEEHAYTEVDALQDAAAFVKPSSASTSV